MAIDFSKVGAEAAGVEDLTVEKKFERELPVTGVALVRYVGYIETGKHLPKNPTYNAAQKCIHVFELNHPRHLIELDGGEKVPQRMFVHQNKGRTGKSGYMKLFKVMNLACDNKFHHFIQMLGQGFLAEVYHNKSDDGKTTYANLHLDQAWSFKKPVQVDALSGAATTIPVPEAHQELSGFLWENDAVSDDDVKQMWDELYIDGLKDNGETKNWIQETIQDNMEWEGSRTQSLTEEFVGLDDPELEETTASEADLMKLASASSQPNKGLADEVPF